MNQLCKIITIAGAFALLLIGNSCDKSCNDCLEMTVKSVRVVDESGNNLLFGDNSMYPPDSVKIKVADQQPEYTWKNVESGTVQFNLDRNYSEYYFFLTDTIIDTLRFDISERESTKCCGTVAYSTKTYLNGAEISNEDVVTIVK
mgnify:FL=1